MTYASRARAQLEALFRAALRAVDAAVSRRKAKIRRRLEVHVGDTSKLEALLKFIRRIDPDADQLDYKRTGEREGVLVVSCKADDVAKMSEMLASHKTVTHVEELSPLYWPQGTGNRPAE